MATRTGRKITGGKYHKRRKRKSYEKPSQGSTVSIGDTKKKKIRIKSGKKRTILLKSNSANVIIKGKVKKAEIKNVEETPQNVFLARQNRLMKGSIILTSLGKARITNRPSREGQVNAVLVEEEK